MRIRYYDSSEASLKGNVILSEVNVRLYSQRDFEALDALWRELLAYHQGLSDQVHGPEATTDWVAYMHKCLITTTVEFHLAELDGAIVGFVSYRMFMGKQAAEIENIMVSPSARRKGIGTTLLKAAEETLAAAKIKTIEINCIYANTDAAEFYKKHGYTPKAIRFNKQLKEGVLQ